ncbi:MAG: Stress response protein nst1 [Claussenomyces sp. TS43310]|nr:MAG: Stress response protein nst1 [Claussenomyces sp. TS43310]
MPAKQRHQPVQSPASPTSQSTAKYMNKDGSKFITVPKVSSAAPNQPTEISAAMAQNSNTNGQAPNATSDQSGTVPVNRKKQKRRQKQAEQAARVAARQIPQATGRNRLQGPDQPISSLPAVANEVYEGFDGPEGDRPYYSDEEGDAHSESYTHSGSPADGYALPPASISKSSKKKKGKSAQHDPQNRSGLSSGKPFPRTNTLQTTQPSMSKEKIWNTSSQEERERIKAFWLSLGEEERRSLVKVEKDAVLKKMKEQQKHSCSCTVCGRKRVAIEEELEVLYDAYYEELEQYANHQQGDRPPPMMAASRRFGQLSGLQPPHRLPPAFNSRQPSRGKIIEHFGDDDDEEGDEEYSDEELDEEDYSDEEAVEEIPRTHATDFFNFGQSLTVQGGILTVADDLLKNDGKKFIEMMEQLAERRMAREEDAKEQYSNGYGHPANGVLPPHHSHGHNHPPPPDDEEYDDEEDEDEEYDSQDEDYDDEEAMDTMTEEQRMEEGRRMFQIFAARMFEQRVLSAYREKVAAERQGKLIEEEAEEAIAAELKKAKKAKDAQKKKEKAQQKKAALAAEKAKREAEKAAEEAALRAAEEKKAEEARLRAEEKRKKREAQKKAEEEERLKKEAEKQRRLQEQRERQADLERKQREAKERERKEKEELKQKEREAKEAKERETRERREKHDREKRESEAKNKAEKAAKDQQKREEPVNPAPALPAQIQRRPQPQVPVPLPVTLQSHSSFASPHVAVATPVVPKAPTPNRTATNSLRDPNSIPHTPQVGSNTSQSASPNPSTPQQSSPGPMGLSGKTPAQQPFLHHPQATSPIHATIKGPPGVFSPGPFAGIQTMGMNGFQQGMPMMAPGYGTRMHHDPMFPHQHAMGTQFRPPNGMPLPPGMNGMPIPQGRSFPGQHAPPGFPPQGPAGGMSQAFAGHKDAGQAHVHSRQHSASFDKQSFENAGPAGQTHPIARPAPIGRPSSTVQGQRPGESHGLGKNDIDDLSNHLGSSALLDDSDEPLTATAGTRRASGAPGMGRQAFAQSAPFGLDPSGFGSPLGYGTWAPPPNPFGTSSLPGSSYMGGWSNSGSFGAVGGSNVRPSQPRSVAVRLMLCNACKNLEGSSPDGFIDITTIRDQLERLNPPRDEPISDKELLDLCETEGNPNNGGGYFDVRIEGEGHTLIRYEPEISSHGRPIGAPGEIGSPIVSSGMAPIPHFGGSQGISTPGGF